MLEMCLFLLQSWFILIHFHLVAKKKWEKKRNEWKIMCIFVAANGLFVK